MIEIDHARWASRLVPRRLAQLRLQVLEVVLDDLERMRLEGERTLPASVSAVIGDLARAHDCTLTAVADVPSQDITIAERQLLEAQEQVMLELASLGVGLIWAEMA